MLSFKKIGIIFSILGLIALTGALMAGPAFASKKGGLGGAEDGATHKMDICHFNAGGDWVADPNDLINGGEFVEVDVWMFQTVDISSAYKHIDKHNEGGMFDFEILSNDVDAGVTLAACDDLVNRD